MPTDEQTAWMNDEHSFVTRYGTLDTNVNILKTFVLIVCLLQYAHRWKREWNNLENDPCVSQKKGSKSVKKTRFYKSV